MTSATVTYHELPPLASWASDSQQNRANTINDRSSSINLTIATSQFGVNQSINAYPNDSNSHHSNNEILWPANDFYSPAQFQQIPSISPSQTTGNDFRSKKRGNSFRTSNLTPSSSSNGILQQTISEELCLVCGDKASGYHYNALTCEGCKGFFRRSITRKAIYYCKYGERCDIDMYMRRKCQHCRLKKCMDIGMRPERLRADSRVPLVVIPEDQCRIKREAKQRLRSMADHRKSLSPTQSVTSTETSDCGISVETRELINRLIAVDNQFLNPSNDSLMQLSNYNTECGSYRNLAELTILNVQLIHQFTSHLPGFCKLTEEDKRTLHKACKTEILVIRTARSYDSNGKHIVLGNDLKQWHYDREQYRSFIGSLADSIFDFAHVLAKLQLDQAEFVILSAIAVFSDRLGLVQPKAVEDIQEVYTSALQAYLDYRRPKQKAIFATLLMKLTDLRSLTSDQAEIFSDISSATSSADISSTLHSPIVLPDIRYVSQKEYVYDRYIQNGYEAIRNDYHNTTSLNF